MNMKQELQTQTQLEGGGFYLNPVKTLKGGSAMIENREFIKQTCKDLRNDLDFLFKTFTFAYEDIDKNEEEIWDGAVVHLINEIPRDEYDVKYTPRYIGSICRVRGEEERERIKQKIREVDPEAVFVLVTHEFIDVYDLEYWRLLVWKTWNYHKSKFFDIRTFYLTDYEIYISGGEPTEEQLWHGWNGNPSYVYNFSLGIDESFTVMRWEQAQEFVNKLIKEYDWFWYIE